MKDEIIEELNNRHLNVKTNNMIIVIDNHDDILSEIGSISKVSFMYDEFNINTIHNIKIDMNDIIVKDILNHILSYLVSLNVIDDTYDLSLNNSLSIFKFESILRNNNIAIQLLLYNLEMLNPNEQMLLNELYYYNSPYFCVTSFVKDNLVTYSLSKNRMLDSRDNYQKYDLTDKPLLMKLR